jgi:hypothetical protein
MVGLFPLALANFRQDEHFQVLVRQAAEGPIGSAQKVPLVQDEVLVCDIRRTAGQTQIIEADIDLERRQAFVFAEGTAVEVSPGSWQILAPVVNTVQSTFDAVDALFKNGSRWSGSFGARRSRA